MYRLSSNTRTMRINWIILITILFVSSCSSKVDIDEMQDYLVNPENGLRKKHIGNGIKYSLQYIPKELMIYKEIQTSQMPKNQIERELSDLEYFHLLIDKDNSNKTNGSKASFYYAYQFEKDIYHLIAEDTIRPQLYLLEQGINGAKKMTINLAFASFDKENIIIEINDKYGVQSQYKYRKQDILNIPSLNY